MNKLAILGIILVVALAGVAFALRDDLMKLAGEAASPAPGQAESLLSPEDTAMQAKLEPLIDCLNGVDSSMRRNFADYKAEYELRVAGQETFFSNFANFKVEVYEQNNEMSLGCAAKLEAAATTGPAAPEVDATAKAYAATLRELIPVLNEADIYYDQEDFKDDAMAKGRELDARMTPMFMALFAESEKIDAFVTTQSIRLRRAELTAMEAANGRDFDWQVGNVMFEARTVIDRIDVLASKGTLAVDELQKLEAAMQAAFDEATAYAAANPDVLTSLGNKPLWFQIEGDVSDYMGKIKDLRRAAADGTADLAPQINGTFEAFNDLVSTYNMMNRF